MVKRMKKWVAKHFFTQMHDALKWDQIVTMGIVGLALYVIVQNDASAKALGATIITTVQTTVQNMLSASF